MSPEAINAVSNDGDTALIWAASNDMQEVCEMLIPKMSPEAINAVSNDGDTALIWAASQGMKEVCEMLIPKMSPEAINVADKSGKTALDYAISGDHKQIEQLIKPVLATNPIIIEEHEVGVSKFEQLLTAIKSDDTTGAQKLIIQMNKQEVSAVDDDGKTALHWAAEKDNEKVAKLLLAKKPDLISIEDKCENTALVLAVLFDSEKVSQLLNNFTGKGLEEHNEESYWYEYSKEGINKLLALRLDNSCIEGVKTVDPVLWSDSFSTIERLSNEIVSNLGGDTGKILVPLNLYGKHWVGIITEKSASKVNLTYMDSEQQKMPALLREQLTTQIAASFECQVSITEPKLELQKFNNCGVEMIENFLLYLTGCRLSQEKAVEFHSWLLEEDLTIGQNLQNVEVYSGMEQVYLAGANTQFHVDH
jgi:ankyrin repeat protein